MGLDRFPLQHLRIVTTTPPPSWFGGVDHAFAVDMAEELARLGATVLSVEVDAFAAKDRNRIDQATDAIRSFNADVALALPNAGYAVLCATLEGKNVFTDVLNIPTILIWDHGMLQFSQLLLHNLPDLPGSALSGCVETLRRALNHPLYLHYSPDRGHIAAADSLGIIDAANVRPFVHFAFPTYARRDRDPATADDRFRSRIAFAGNLYLEKSETRAWRAHPELARIEGAMLDGKEETPTRSYWELLLAEINKCDGPTRQKLSLDPDRTFFWSFLRDAIQYVGNTRARLNMLSGLAEPCDIFGNFVEPQMVNALRERFGLRLRGNLDCVQDLPWLYRNSEVVVDVINSGYISGSSPKVTSCLAAGGLILFDYKEDFRAGFGDLADLLMYRSLPDLNSRIDDYLSKPAKRREVAAAAREKALREFTFSSLCRRMFCDEPPWRSCVRESRNGRRIRADGEVKAMSELAESADALVGAVGDSGDLTVLRSWGNRGDELIYAGIRSLLRDRPYREHDLRKLDSVPSGTTAIISGGGSWCRPYHVVAEFLPQIESRFSRVIVFPSSFDTSEPAVREALSRTNAIVFARERESYEQIRGLCDARLAHDTAFFFDFGPFRSGFHAGVLDAFRTDAEAAGHRIPAGNRDISADCETLNEWLWTISRHDLIRTDRAHVVIAAAMLGKRVEWRPSAYHKVAAIISFSISSPKVTQLAGARDEDIANDLEVDRLTPPAEASRKSLPATVPPPRSDEEISRLTAALEESRAALDALHGSWSWRLTAPCRSLVDAVRSLRRAK